MSRSNPTEVLSNPATKWIEWKGDSGNFSFYDKEKKEKIPIPKMPPFMILDKLYSIGGYNDSESSSIASNQIKNTKTDKLVVRFIKTNTIFAEGLYKDISEKIKSKSGKFQAVLYAAINGKDGFTIVALQLKGAAFSSWVDFETQLRKSGKQSTDGAVIVSKIETGTKGKTTYKYPVFAQVPVSDEDNAQAVELDKTLQKYLASRTESASVTTDAPTENFTEEPNMFDDEIQRLRDAEARANEEFAHLPSDDEDDDLPF
jgi:hypothetical protein